MKIKKLCKMNITNNVMLIDFGMIRLGRYHPPFCGRGLIGRHKVKSIGRQGRKRKKLGWNIMLLFDLRKLPKKPLQLKSGNVRMYLLLTPRIPFRVVLIGSCYGYLEVLKVQRYLLPSHPVPSPPHQKFESSKK
jgi:hypothetical protein